MRAKLFASFLVTSLATAFLCIFVIRLLDDKVNIFWNMHGMGKHHLAHPYQYASVLCVSYALVAAFGMSWIAAEKRSGRWVRTLIIVFGSGVLASVPWGLLWMTHMVLKSSGSTDGMWLTVLWNGLTGATLAWVVMLMSFPFNLICVVAGFFYIMRALPYMDQLVVSQPRREPPSKPISILDMLPKDGVPKVVKAPDRRKRERGDSPGAPAAQEP